MNLSYAYKKYNIFDFKTVESVFTELSMAFTRNIIHVSVFQCHEINLTLPTGPDHSNVSPEVETLNLDQLSKLSEYCLKSSFIRIVIYHVTFYN